MPKYRFICANCKQEKIQYLPVSSTIESFPCGNCDSGMIRQLPRIEGQTEVRELVDPYTNITWGKDHEVVMKDRRNQHFRDVEIPRLVNTYSIETCLENKWLVYNDKGELVINKDWNPST